MIRLKLRVGDISSEDGGVEITAPTNQAKALSSSTLDEARAPRFETSPKVLWIAASTLGATGIVTGIFSALGTLAWWTMLPLPICSGALCIAVLAASEGRRQGRRALLHARRVAVAERSVLASFSSNPEENTVEKLIQRSGLPERLVVAALHALHVRHEILEDLNVTDGEWFYTHAAEGPAASKHLSLAARVSDKKQAM